MRHALIVGAVAILMFAGTALGEEQSSPAAPGQPQDPDSEVICKMMPPAAGSRLGRRRECHTKREWDARRNDDRTMTEESQMKDSRGVAP